VNKLYRVWSTAAFVGLLGFLMMFIVTREPLRLWVDVLAPIATWVVVISGVVMVVGLLIDLASSARNNAAAEE